MNFKCKIPDSDAFLEIPAETVCMALWCRGAVGWHKQHCSHVSLKNRGTVKAMYLYNVGKQSIHVVPLKLPHTPSEKIISHIFYHCKCVTFSSKCSVHISSFLSLETLYKDNHNSWMLSEVLKTHLTFETRSKRTSR